jgi:hypothetical protein
MVMALVAANDEAALSASVPSVAAPAADAVTGWRVEVQTLVPWEVCSQSVYACDSTDGRDCAEYAKGFCAASSNCIAVASNTNTCNNQQDPSAGGFVVYTDGTCVLQNKASEACWDIWIPTFGSAAALV